MSNVPQNIIFFRLIIILSKAILDSPLRFYAGLNKIITITLPHWPAPGALRQLHFSLLHSGT